MNNDEILNLILSKIYKRKDDFRALTDIFNFLEAKFQEFEVDDLKIPSDVQHLITEISGAIDIGMICYLNPKTNAVIQILPEDDRSMLFGEEQDEGLDQELGIIEKWDEKIVFAPLDAHEVYFIMEHFVENVDDKNFKKTLGNALMHKRPINNFKQLIENSKFRADWFKFKQIAVEQTVYKRYVKEISAIS